MIALFSPFIVQHLQSNERSRDERFVFLAFREAFCDHLYIRVVKHVYIPCLFLSLRCSMCLLVCMCLCTHKLLLILVTCCSNRARYSCCFSFYFLFLMLNDITSFRNNTMPLEICRSVSFRNLLKFFLYYL